MMNQYQHQTSQGDKKELERKRKLSEFYNIWDRDLKLSQEEDNILSDLNNAINANFNKHNHHTHNNTSATSSSSNVSLLESEHQRKIEEMFKKSLADIEQSKSQLSQITKDIDYSFNKLFVILQCRNELSSTLKEFNNSTKTLIGDQEKLQKLCRSVEKMLKHYEVVHSIQALFDNTGAEVVEKLRFVTDYEEVENGIQFFTINKDYTEAERYLNTHKMLKKIAINRYYEYIMQSINNTSTTNENNDIQKHHLFLFIAKNAPKSLDKRVYNFPKNFEKMRVIQQFFERKKKYDHDVSVTVDKLKVTFLKKRAEIFSPYLQEILRNIDASEEALSEALAELIKLTVCELLYFCLLFQTKISESIFNIQTLTDEIFNTLYSSIRPLIISADKLDELFSFFNALDHNLSFLYYPIPEEKPLNLTEVKNLFQNFTIYDNENLTSLINDGNLNYFIDFLKCAKRVIIPTITNIVKDIQEKVYFKTSLQIKKNFVEMEQEFNDFTVYEEKITSVYKNYPLFHFFLRKLSMILFLLKNKLDKEVLSELTIQCIEKFINLINEEIFNKKDITITFQIYIIQQLVLALQIIEDNDLEVVDKKVDIDFHSITDIFKENVKMLFTQLNIREVISNSIPKILNQSQDYKKVLYNHLIKSYSIFVNVVNDLIFGREIMEVVYKIRKHEDFSSEYFETRVMTKQEKFENLYTNFELVLKEIKEQLFIVDDLISNKIIQMALENITGILGHLDEEIGRQDASKFQQISKIIEAELSHNNLNKMVLSHCSK